MALATRLGPWLLGTVKNTTGTTAGTIRNTAPTVVAQTFKKDYTGSAFGSATTDQIAVLPAGAQILNIYIDTLTAFTGSTAANLTVGTAASNNAYWTTTNITTAGRAATTNAVLSAWAGAASSAAPAGIGIGSTDVIVNAYLTPTVANVTAGTVQYTIEYTVRNPDGTSAPTATTA